MIDRLRPAIEEALEGVGIGGVKRLGASRTNLARSALEPLRATAGEDNLGPFLVCTPGRFEADASAAADDDDGLTQ